MAITNGYCTETEATDWLQITGKTVASDLTILDDVVTGVSRQLDVRCRGENNTFYQQANTRTFIPDNRYLLDIDDLALSTGITLKTDNAGDGTFETTWTGVGTDFQLLPVNAPYGAHSSAWTQIRAVGSNTFPLPFASLLARRDRVQIAATWGWPSVPPEIKEACLILSARVFKRRYSPEGAAGFDQMGVVRIMPEDWDAVKFIRPFMRGDEAVVFA